MAQQAASEFLVTPEWLHAHLNDPNVRVADGCPPDQYTLGHIPGAANVDFMHIGTRDTSAEGLRAWTARMEEAFTAAGLDEGQTVVFYEDTSGYNAARGGRIPGAIPLDWVNNLDAEGRLEPLAELEAMYANLGLDWQREVITYCQGGYRAAHTWLVLRMLGYPRVRNYLGSWGEWGNREGLPIENLTLPDAAKPA